MFIKVKSNKVTFSVEFHEKYTIITGNSASQKTMFYNKISEANLEYSPIKVIAPLPVIAVGKHDTADNLVAENVIYVIDERSALMKELGKLKDKNAYFLLIFRETIENFTNFNMLPLSVTSILEFKRDGKNVYSIPKYKKFDTHNFGNIDLVLTEDRKSSKLFFEHYYNLLVESANGKANIVSKLNELYDRQKKILLVYDSCGFGTVFEKLLIELKNKPNVAILDWESFEEYLLNSPFFKHPLPEDSPCDVNGREIYAKEVLKSLIPYNENKLPYCLVIENKCINCHDSYRKQSSTSCDYSISSDIDKRALFVYGALKTIINNK